MKKIYNLILLGVTIFIFTACKRTDFLNSKPNSAILNPTTLEDMQKLLDFGVMNTMSSGLAQMASDEYELTYENWQSASVIERNSYLWANNLYEGSDEVRDWNYPFLVVFYANCVLEGLENMEIKNTPQWSYIRGQALFKRAYANYELLRNFCVPYDESSSTSDLGIPIRLLPGIDEVVPRANLEESYRHVFNDLFQSESLLSSDRAINNFFRPTRLAVYAFLARIYLEMREYEEAEKYADKTLNIYDQLIDYNIIDTLSDSPFSIDNDELIYNSMTVGTYYISSIGNTAPYTVTKDLINLFDEGDLRLKVYFTRGKEGNYRMKRGYSGAGLYPFTGLATDEIFLIKAEGLARRGEIQESMSWLRRLLKNRYSNYNENIEIEASSSGEALSKILLERRKELVWRCIRWQDIKRLNKEDYEIILMRNLNGERVLLQPNDSRYTFPIPDNEIILSKIKQN